MTMFDRWRKKDSVATTSWFLSRPEKRNYERVDVELPVELVVEGKKISATATNVSCGGLFLPIKTNLVEERTDIEMMLNLPEATRPVRVVGEVARYQEGSFIKKRPEGVAIRFQGLYDDNILAIDKFIKNRFH